MNNTILGLVKIFASTFVFALSLLGILALLGVITADDLTDNAAKIGGVLLILVVASALMALIQGSDNKK